MNDITTAIALMDEKGRHIDDKTIGLWEKDWNWLRELLLTVKLRAEREEARIEELRKRSLYQRVDTVEAGVVITDVKIDKLCMRTRGVTQRNAPRNGGHV